MRSVDTQSGTNARLASMSLRHRTWLLLAGATALGLLVVVLWTKIDFKGRAVVLNLWATWCVPCRQEMPSLDRLQAKLGGPRFQVLAVSIDKQGATVVQPFYRELGLQSLGIYLDPSGQAPSVLGVEGVPVTLLINAQGREIGRKLGALEWDSPAMIDTLRQAFGFAETPQRMPATPEERDSP